MQAERRLQMLGKQMERELLEHLLPYWMERTPDDEHGGFVGRITGANQTERQADRGVVLFTRILWTFSAASRMYGDPRYAEIANRAWSYLAQHFLDPVDGGVFWMLDHVGRPTDDRKHVYAQGFAIYSLTEHFRATGSTESLDAAKRLFRLVEDRCRDRVQVGYHEAFDRRWNLLEDVRLSDKDFDAPKSMNTHLHVMEAYADLYGVWNDRSLRESLEELVELFLSKIIDSESYQTHPFFDAEWTPLSRMVSFGHDIETSWLLLEAADVLGDESLRLRAAELSLQMAERVLRRGMDSDGGLFNEVRHDGSLDTDKHWWPQAEAMVGFVNAYQESDELAFLDAAEHTWRFITDRVIDHENGEWFYRVTRDGRPIIEEDKVGPWKSPYHSARACMEVAVRSGVAA